MGIARLGQFAINALSNKAIRTGIIAGTGLAGVTIFTTVRAIKNARKVKLLNQQNQQLTAENKDLKRKLNIDKQVSQKVTAQMVRKNFEKDYKKSVYHIPILEVETYKNGQVKSEKVINRGELDWPFEEVEKEVKYKENGDTISYLNKYTDYLQANSENYGKQEVFVKYTDAN